MHTPEPEYNPAGIAARLRAFIARHDENRRIRQELIGRLEDYAGRLKIQNMVAGQVVGRLRRLAQHYDHQARLVRESKRRLAA
jgi:hypothetical protein